MKKFFWNIFDDYFGNSLYIPPDDVQTPLYLVVGINNISRYVELNLFSGLGGVLAEASVAAVRVYFFCRCTTRHL